MDDHDATGPVMATVCSQHEGRLEVVLDDGTRRTLPEPSGGAALRVGQLVRIDDGDASIAPAVLRVAPRS